MWKLAALSPADGAADSVTDQGFFLKFNGE